MVNNIQSCIQCHSRPIFNKKRKLCERCYRKFRKLNGPLLTPKEREIQFIKNYFTHLNWIYQPVTFRLNGCKYTPDFYDGERHIFIELAGTRQAYHANKGKYAELKKMFPKIEFEVRTPDGELLNEKVHRLSWA